MADSYKVIVFRGYKASRTVVRLIENQVEKWIRREMGVHLLPENLRYRIEIEKETGLPFFSCLLKVQLGSREWRSRESGRTLPDALAHCLKRIHLNESRDSYSIKKILKELQFLT